MEAGPSTGHRYSGPAGRPGAWHQGRSWNPVLFGSHSGALARRRMSYTHAILTARLVRGGERVGPSRRDIERNSTRSIPPRQ